MRSHAIDRRRFVHLTLFTGAGALLPESIFAQDTPLDDIPGEFPRQAPSRVREVVTVSHRSLEAVRELVEATPELAKAGWDWGFGDWETALDAAAHTGQREIADYLLHHGARPTLFCAAMLGQLEVVRAWVSASPGVQSTLGPHGITLLSHARAGGDDAREVVSYLQDVGGADPVLRGVPLEPDERMTLTGRYAFGPGEDDVLVIEDRRDALWIQRPGHARRGLRHVGDGVFHPAGAPSVRIVLDGSDRMQVQAGTIRLDARR